MNKKKKLKVITQEELNCMMHMHEMWLIDDKTGKRADFSYYDLSGLDMSNRDLSRAIMVGTKLWGTNLTETTFYKANLIFCSIVRINLKNSYFVDSDLSFSSISDIEVKNVNFDGVNFMYSHMVRAHFYDCNFKHAIMSKGWEECKTLSFFNCDLYLATNVPFIPFACPVKGSFTGFKQALSMDGSYVVVELRIPASAKRSSATGRKCRCNKAKVVAIYDCHGNKLKETKAKSTYDTDFIYKVGKTVEVDNFCTDRFAECAPGIHFFITFEEAANYLSITNIKVTGKGLTC